MLTLYEFWRGLEKSERIQFCETASISYRYMESHLIHGRKKPSMETIQKMVDASNKKLTHEGLFNFFLGKTSEQQVTV
ncbi:MULTISPECIES: transcriptional regulator [unclassified Acinetobacter]|uniref:transcriptional regulator n=1 Tax=unclassified Acinetobacter TaxID=196816 RepID=UPI000B3D2BCD|nr:MULTISPECIES: transcriptional regulator [unclassified Acinetobacter]MDH0032040.1 XRE family transcriptional regulator [Acinetobacter sp. GD04021]MDH0887696.1 XRE family transcriptional regulator [Acinetobacter sp. GD03873]MDH1084044.1 XRE family transcriptional regulator [Acinetobacter sp. GD03983]MDH2191029.1 XRE family transcriptional regulator [Acinetobacter sp. GD03645]MDH2204556.1 XRE family transcriptional regulator [Acinetobacter sp. GD03647]